VGSSYHGFLTAHSVTLPFCLDTGADCSLVTEAQARLLVAGVPAVHTALPEPLVLATAAEGAFLHVTATLHLPP
jgi:hypothetical protein